jgi:hypothetical protein
MTEAAGKVREAAATHTPGHWRTGGHYITAHIGDKQTWIATVKRTDASDAEGEANACLIAAAPDLLSALRGILENIEPDCHTPDCPDCGAWRAARAAIARATGAGQ